MRAGDKVSHWMWFVFPQLAGLGRSEMARRYAIADLAEARAYLAHPLLGPRLAECTDLMLGWGGRRSAEAILGSIDATKFVSSMTVFAAAEGGARYSRALGAFNGGRHDPKTLELLGQPGG